MQELYSEPSDLDGFDELKPEDKEKVRKAFQDGHVADEDIPETAKKEGAAGEEDEDEEGEKPKKKTASRKRKDTEAEGEPATEKPKRSRTTKAKASSNTPPYHSTDTAHNRRLMVKKSQRRQLPEKRFELYT